MENRKTFVLIILPDDNIYSHNVIDQNSTSAKHCNQLDPFPEKLFNPGVFAKNADCEWQIVPVNSYNNKQIGFNDEQSDFWNKRGRHVLENLFDQ